MWKLVVALLLGASVSVVLAQPPGKKEPRALPRVQIVDEAGKPVSGEKLASVKPIPERLRAIAGDGAIVKVSDAGEVVEVFLGDKASDELLGELRTLPKLRSLDVQVSKQITDVGFAHIGTMSALESLNLYDLG
ncbi:MAG: hypothetical protein ABR915_07635, partial [Thermoguttaceae bacterium]